MKEKVSTTTVRQVLSVYWHEVKQNRFLGIAGFVCMAAGTILTMIPALYYKQFFDLMSSAGASDQTATLLRIVAIVFLIHMIENVFVRLGALCDATLESRVMASLRERSFAVILSHSYTFFSNNFTGALVQKVNRLTRSFERFWDALFYGFFPLGIRIVGAIYFLAQENRLITLALVVWTVLFLLFNILFSMYKLKYDALRAARESRVTASLADAITNCIPVKLFTGASHEGGRFHDVSETHRRTMLFTWKLNIINDTVQMVLFCVLEFVLFYIGIQAWKEGVLSIGGFIMIQTYFFLLLGRLWDIGRKIRDVYESIADSREMVEILNMKQGVADVPSSAELIVTRGQIRFQNVVFTYPGQRPVINRLSFTIKGGERVALVGSSGAGKSTIINLLMRFHDIQAGSITIDGRNIAKVTQESLRSQIAFVPQEPILFHRSLLENIRYGRRDADDADVYRASELAHCTEFIKNLPKGYDTLVGERGIKLSGGERQRIAIARAILKNAPILILDEATSSLDSYSETLIQDAFDAVMKDKTTIAIAHRLSTIRKMDRIIVLSKGEIEEEGSHAQLLAKRSSHYKKLWKLQSGGFLKDEENGTKV